MRPVEIGVVDEQLLSGWKLVLGTSLVVGALLQFANYFCIAKSSILPFQAKTAGSRFMCDFGAEMC